MKKLILTGWGWKDYACAAALALRKFPDSDVLGMSTRRLPEFLNEVAGYKEIIILGISLSGNPELLEHALKRLHSQGVRLRWLSALDFPESLNENIRAEIDHFIAEEDSLTEVAAQCFQLQCHDLLPLLVGDPIEGTARRYHQLLEAAMYVYRNHQDEEAYGNAIRHIAKRDSEEKWSEQEKTLIEYYKRFGHRELVGKSAVMQELQRKINLIASRDPARVLILGESGTGKETVALQLHNKSPRRNKPYVAFNCASVTPNLLESRFFGHEKGAFTGANEQKRGLFELANGGTLFLDEIGELPLEAQGILLRVLEEGRFTRMGGNNEIKVDVRLITATNRDLAAMVCDGKFREDLFYRLNVIPVRVPSLREHKSDIASIADSYWLRQCRRHLSPDQIDALQQYDYPGNVRELFHLLERANVLGETNFAELIAEQRRQTAGLNPPEQPKQPELPDELAAATRQHVRHVYEKYDCNLTRAAKALKISRNTARNYLEET